MCPAKVKQPEYLSRVVGWICLLAISFSFSFCFSTATARSAMSPLGAKVPLMKPLQTLQEEHREHRPLLHKDSDEVMSLKKFLLRNVHLKSFIMPFQLTLYILCFSHFTMKAFVLLLIAGFPRSGKSQ